MTISFEQRYGDYVADQDVGPPKRRQRRRMVSFAIVGVLGLVLSAAWAAGVLTTNPSTGDATATVPFRTSAPGADTNPLADMLTPGEDATPNALVINFSGRWGVIPDDTTVATPNYELFEVDLTGATTTTQKHFVEIGVANSTALDEFRVLQIAFVMNNVACSATALDTVDETQVLYADTNDAAVVFSNLTKTAGPAYCIGVKPVAKANEPTGTFIRRDGMDTTMPTPMPEFFAVLNVHN